MNFLDPNPKGFPIVLLLHGLGVNSSSWMLQFDTLISAGFRPIAPDILGFGESEYDGLGWSIARNADLLIELLTQFNSGPVFVVGLSMGGVIAQQLTLSYPTFVKKLVLVSTFTKLRPTKLFTWFYFLLRALMVYIFDIKTQAKIVALKVFPAPGQLHLRKMAEAQIAQADPRAYREAMKSLFLFNSTKRLKEITIPTLVVIGENDTTISPAHQMELSKNIPGAKHIIIQKGGHAVTIDHYDEFNQALLKFLHE
ncbi:MAG: alpha/beta hydrolase [Chloroflexota bacterium]